MINPVAGGVSQPGDRVAAACAERGVAEAGQRNRCIGDVTYSASAVAVPGYILQCLHFCMETQRRSSFRITEL
jgi:hypothetical protein